MRLRTLISSAVVAAAVLLLPSKTTEAQAQFVASFGSAAPEGTPWADQLIDIKNRVEEESGGKVKMKLFLGSVLGGEVEMIRDVRRNSRLQGGGFSTGAIAVGAKIPLLELPELAYLFETMDQADCVLDTVLYKPADEALAAKDFKLHAGAENGWRHMGTKDKPVKTPADLAGMKMRSQESDVHVDMYSALGANPVTLPISEVLTGLNTGIVDGFDNSPLFTQAAGLYEPINYYTLTGHIYQPAAVIWSKRFWDTLPPDLQTMILGDPQAEADKGRQGVRALEKALLENFPGMGVKVVELTAAERQAFKAKTASVHTKYTTDNPAEGATLKKVKAALAGPCK